MSLVSPLVELFAAHGRDASKSEAATAVGTRDVGDDVLAASMGVVLADISDWGHFTLGGRDGAKFLQGLVTNDVVGLAPGAGCRVAFLNVHGRFEAVATVFSCDGVLVLQTPPAATLWVETFLSKYRRAGDFQFERIADAAAVTLQGPLAGAVLGEVLGTEPGADSTLWCGVTTFEGVMLRIMRSPRSLAGGYDVVGPADAVRDLVERVCAKQPEPPVVIGDGALEVLRIEAGIPAYLKDFDADTVLQEIDEPDIVSFNKGCYLGQEIVARIHFQGQPSKLLRRLTIPGDCVPVAGDEVLAEDDEKSAGRITSVAVSPTRGLIVFAMIKRRFYQPGTSVRIRRDDREFKATVVERVGAPATEDAP